MFKWFNTTKLLRILWRPAIVTLVFVGILSTFGTIGLSSNWNRPFGWTVETGTGGLMACGPKQTTFTPMWNDYIFGPFSFEVSINPTRATQVHKK
ncbi:MAG: hypothetical protein ABJA67_13435 [Chthonomonadales bacterium]